MMNKEASMTVSTGKESRVLGAEVLGERVTKTYI